MVIAERTFDGKLIRVIQEVNVWKTRNVISIDVSKYFSNSYHLWLDQDFLNGEAEALLDSYIRDLEFAKRRSLR